MRIEYAHQLLPLLGLRQVLLRSFTDNTKSNVRQRRKAKDLILTFQRPQLLLDLIYNF